MKLIAIGDIHGRDIWKAIVEKEKDADKIVFIGDYFDSFDVPFGKQASNFNDILQFKLAHPEQVVLLIGNHDYQYFWFAKEEYSGHQKLHATDIREVLNAARKEGLIQMAFQHDDFLFTHAGVTQEWLTKNYLVEKSGKTIADEVNDIFYDHPEAFRFTPSNPLDQSGESITQPPIWVRPEALARDAVEGVVQIVGHTRVPHMMTKRGVKEQQFYLIDTLDSSRQYLCIENGKVESKI